MKKIILFLFLIFGISSGFSQTTLNNPLWKINATAGTWFQNTSNERGLAVNNFYDRVLVPSRDGGTNKIIILDAATGSNLGQIVTSTGVAVNLVGCTDDGVTYACHWNLGSTTTTLFRWANLSTTSTTAYGAAAPTGSRVGDAFSVIGSGSNTTVWLGGNNNLKIAQFQPNASNPLLLDLKRYTSIVSPSSNTSGNIGAVVPGLDVDFWANGVSDYIRKFRAANTTCTLYSSEQIPSSVASSSSTSVTYIEIGIRKYLLINDGNTSKTARVVDITNGGGANAFVKYITMSLGSNTNGNATGVCAFDTKRNALVVINTNNAIASFSIDSLPPVLLASPVNSSTTTPNLRLKWNKVRDITSISFLNKQIADKYHYQVSTSNSNWTAPNLVKDGYITDSKTGLIGDSSAIVKNLLNNTTYYWRVCAVLGQREYNYSAPQSFTTSLIVPTIVSPDSGETVSINPLLQWLDCFADEYYVQVSKNSSFTDMFWEGSVTGDTMKQLNDVPIATYYWRVKARYGANWTDYQVNPYPFTTDIVKPGLVTPITNANVNSLTPTLTWTNIAGNLYNLQISKNNTFTQVVYDQNINGTPDALGNLGQVINGLPINTQLFWRVRARFNTVWSLFSEIWNFTLTIQTITTDKPEINFNDMKVGISDNQDITIMNTGLATLTISKLKFGGVDSSMMKFQSAPTAPFTIPPGGKQIITLKFQPTSFGNKIANLIIKHDDPTKDSLTISLKGTVLANIAKIQIPESINFGTNYFLTPPAEANYYIISLFNPGADYLHVNKIYIEGNEDIFQLIDHAPVFVNSNDSVKMRIRFNPIRTGVFNAKMHIINGSSNNPDAVINLYGVVPQTSLIVNPSTSEINFGKTTITNPSKRDTIILQNFDSPVPLEIISKTIEGDTSFKFIYNRGDVILTTAQGQNSDTIIIEFYPHTSGNKTAKLVLNSDYTLAPIMYINLTGIGGDKPVLSIDQPSISFGDVIRNIPAYANLVIKNDGNLDLNLTQLNIIGEDKNLFTIIGNSNPVSLLAQQTDTIRIQFKGNLPVGPKSAQLELVSNDETNGVLRIDLNGTLKSPAIETNIPKIIFDTTGGNIKTDSVIKIKNVGNLALRVKGFTFDGPNSSDFTWIDIPLPFVLEPGEEKSVTVKFIPIANGQRFARFIIQSDDPVDSSKGIVLRGLGEQYLPGIAGTSKTFDFGYVPLNNSKDSSLLLVNSGLMDLTIKSIELEGENSSFFSIGQANLPLTIPARQSISLTVRLMPTSAINSISASLKITSNDLSNPIYYVSLTGSIVKPSIAIDSVLDFGSVMLLQSYCKELVIKSNSSYSGIRIDSIYIDAPFTFTKPVLPFSINPGNELRLQVCFSPEAKGNFEGSLYVKSTNYTSNIITVKLIGIGLGPELSVPANLDFGKVANNQSVNKNLIITNNGDSYLKIISVKIVGKDSSEFKTSSMTFPFTIDPTKNDNVSIIFNPKTLGIKDARIKIISNDLRNTREVQISAEAVASNIKGVLKVTTDKIPTEFSLNQNYPNPFNPSTMIMYAIPKECNVSLRIFDAIGREIRTIINEYQSPGEYSLTFDAGGLPSGVYFYRLQAGNYVEMKKMFLLK